MCIRDSPLAVAQATDKLIGKKLVTNQTGPEGKVANRIYIEEATDIERELYLGLVFDRSSESIMVVASTEGGMSVEEIAKEKPESNIRSKIEEAVGIQNFQARELAFGLGIEPELIRRASETIVGCAKDAKVIASHAVEPLRREHNFVCSIVGIYHDNLASQIQGLDMAAKV